MMRDSSGVRLLVLISGDVGQSTVKCHTTVRYSVPSAMGTHLHSQSLLRKCHLEPLSILKAICPTSDTSQLLVTTV